MTADVLSVENKRAKIIGQFGVGYNNIDIQAAKAQGLIVTNTPHVLTDCTADIAMLLLLMSARRASEGERLILNKQWTGWTPTQLIGQKVTGKTLGLIGFGRIAQAMAKKAHHGFDMNILFYVPSSVPEQAIIDDLQAVRCASVEDLLAQADFVSLHCPGGAATKHLINEERLKLMRPTAHLINTARGDVVDSEALIKALTEAWIAGAGLDVFEGEPNLNPEFLTLNNVALLPHLGSATLETRIAMGNRVLANIAAFFAGSEPGDRVV
jgi:lactate dehydrogenase-like 2-hydroxyacid dehydrogenase